MFQFKSTYYIISHTYLIPYVRIGSRGYIRYRKFFEFLLKYKQEEILETFHKFIFKTQKEQMFLKVKKTLLFTHSNKFYTKYVI